MSRHYPKKHFSKRSHRQHYVSRPESTLKTAYRYGSVAIVVGVFLAFGSIAWDKHQQRQAILAALPPGFTYSGCDAVRAAGVDPLYRFEPGYSDRMDGDGDGIACEPYR